MQNNKNQEVKGHYLSETTVWFRIAKKYKKRFLNIALRRYVIQHDSVQRSFKCNENPNAESKLHASLIFINEFWNWYIKYDLRNGIINVLIAVKYSVQLGHNLIFENGGGKKEKSLLRTVNPFIPKCIVILASPYKLYWSLRRR